MSADDVSVTDSSSISFGEKYTGTLPDAIQWHEGMLLSPQHFQQQAARLEALLQYQAITVSPFYWGVHHCKANLVNGKLVITALDAIMPDGLVISYNSEKDGDLTLDLKAETGNDASQERNRTLPNQKRASGVSTWLLDPSPLQVHLVVPPNRVVRHDDETARYRSTDGEDVADENLGAGDGKLRFPRLRPRLRLKRATDLSQTDVSFPLIQLNHNGGVYNFASPRFIPPCLAVKRQSGLWELCLDVLNRVREKADHLIKQAQSPGMTTGLALLQDNKTTLQSLIAQLFYFEAALKSGVTHPYQLYLVLCSLAGHVAGIRGDLGPVDFPPHYNHNDLWATFTPLTNFIQESLEKAIAVTYKPHRFKREGDIYSLFFKPEWKKARLVLGLSGHSEMNEMELYRWGDDCLIAPEAQMQTIRENRTLGAKRKRITREGDLVQTRGMVLFALPEDSEYLIPGTNLQVFNPERDTGDKQPSEIILYVFGGESLATTTSKPA